MMNRLRYYIIIGILKAVAMLPFRILYCVSDFICFIVKGVIRYRRNVIYGNLQRSFPETSAKEIKEIADGYYRHLADLVVETIKLLHISNSQLREHIDIPNPELVEKLAEDGRPIVLFLGHYGNWEWVQEVCHRYHKPTYTCELYRPIHDKVMDEVMKRIRSRFETTLIPQKKAVRQLIGLTNEGTQYIVGFIADQRPYSMKGKHHWTTFLNQDTAYVTGGEEIGRHVNAHFLFLYMEKPKRGHYRMTFKKMEVPEGDKEDYPYSRLYLKMMEDNIRHAPQYWLWSHNRWKYDKDGNKINYKLKNS